MKMSRQAWMALCAAGLLASSVGCVTKGTYNELLAERDALSAERDGLNSEVAALEASSEELAASLAATKLKTAKLRNTYGELVTELESEVAAGQIEVQQLVDGIRLNVSDELLFESGSTALNERGQALMARVAGQIKDEDAIISIEGHTDNVGISSALKSRFPTNWELAAGRAASVVRLLSEKGVDPTRMRAVSRGPFKPVASNETAAGRAKNRRTEILLRPVPDSAPASRSRRAQ
jgi:chemotaxis protein MotB